MTIKNLTNSYLRTRSEYDFNNLYNRLKPGIQNYVNGFIKDPDISDDVVSNTFIKLWTKIDQFDPQWSISTWLYRIARNEALGILNKQNDKSSLDQMREFGVQVTTTGTVLDTELDEDLFKTENDFLEDDNEFQQTLESVYLAILNLEDKYRDICKDRLLNNLKYQDLAEKYDLPLQTIKNRIRRGKMLIRKKV